LLVCHSPLFAMLRVGGDKLESLSYVFGPFTVYVLYENAGLTGPKYGPVILI